MSSSGLRSTRPLAAADAVCSTLEGLGARHVFGLPGGQNIDMTEALRRSELEWVVPSHELAAAFAANGYWRSSGRPGVMNAIPGPGFTFALTGLAEAKLDSTALLAITGVRPEGAPGPGLQEIPQERMAAPVLKRSFRVSSADELPGTLARAYRATTAGEPGPVLLQVEDPLWSEACRPEAVEAALEDGRRGPEDDGGRGGSPRAGVMEELRSRLAGASRPVLLVGQGAQEASGELAELAEALGAPALVTTSGRGAIPDSHPLALPLDRLPEALDRAHRLLREADLALVLGCRLGYNATLGGRLEFPPEKLVRVDASAAVMEESGPRASLQVAGDAGAVLRSLLPELGRRERAGDGGRGEPWWREHAGTIPEPGSQKLGDAAEPRVEEGGAVADFFAGLREAMPDDGCLVTDSGLHQMLARKHVPIESPRGLVVPTNFQSMGYGVPAAIGAALARPDSTITALVGDGGLRLSALDLATAKSLGVDLTVIVFADGYYGLIRRGQLSDYGRGSGVELPDVDIEGLCASMDVDHARVGPDPGPGLRDRIRGGGVGVVEVGLRDSAAFRLGTVRGKLRHRLRRLLGPDGVERVKEMLSTWRAWFGESASGA